MINPYYFIHEVLKSGFKNILDSHYTNHIHSKITIILKDFEIEKKLMLVKY